MKLLEHQCKQLLTRFGLPLNQQVIVDTPDAAVQAVRNLGQSAVLKAQVPFGGRGKAGGVKFVESPDETRDAAKTLLDLTLQSVPVRQISVEPKLSLKREIYVGATWDTSAKLPVALVSQAGGIEVEDADGGQIQRCLFDPFRGLSDYQGRELACSAGLSGKTMIGVGQILAKLTAVFLTIDAITLEINPLGETEDFHLIGVDAHIEIEDDAWYRQLDRLKIPGSQPSSGTGRPATELELAAQRIDSMDHRGVAGRVVEFDGDLALLIGGGGASLTVFDAIRRHGGRPANYCEVGGNPTQEKVAALTALLLSKPGVRQLAVIMNVVNNTRADVMAAGVLEGIQRAGLDPTKVVSVFRIPGSWEQEAREILARAGVEALGREISLDRASQLAVLHEPCNG
ncbi:MAG: acetate--CoA ligase family protein [Pirellulales bacterium]|nr:acetate--CoA ligase family protein [Pirellulales bacterium]